MGLIETRYFLRCSRIVGCENYWGESNVIKVAVDKCSPQSISGGEIAFNGPYNPNQGNTIDNVELASSLVADLDLEYVWLGSLVNVPNTVGNSEWTTVEGTVDLLELDIDDLTQTTYFLRCARVAGCDGPYWGESNVVTVEIDRCAEGFVHGEFIEFVGPYDPAGDNIIIS